MKLRAPAIVALLALSCGACDAAVAARAPAVAGSAGHVDPRLGTPTFTWMNRDREASLGTVIEAFGISAADTLSLARVDDTGSGPIVARCEQSSRR